METLADRIGREGPLNELDAVGWAIRLTKRIESMHALGVTHGSVSPQCVQIEGRDRTARAHLVDLRRTSSSIAYHSPERANGGPLSQADDTWALACTLYAALTGSPPFGGGNDADVKQKILTSSPAPLAVFDVGDDDLQRVLDDAFAREPGQRTTSVTTLRKALEEWHPDPNVGGLPGLEDEDTENPADEDEDERTIMRIAPSTRANEPESPRRAPPPAAGAGRMPPAIPSPRASQSGAGAPQIPSPRASSPGFPAPRAASSPGGFPGASPPSPRAAAPGRAGEGAGAFPAPPSPRAPLPGFPAPRAPAASGGFPAPVGPPPGLAGNPPSLDDDDEDEARTMMRIVPEDVVSAMISRTADASRSGDAAPGDAPRAGDGSHSGDAARSGDASRSGAFAAAVPSKSGAFPLAPSLPHAGGDDAEDEATRMMQSPSFPGPDDEDDEGEQKTLMRTSLTAEEVARLGGQPLAGDAHAEAAPPGFGGSPASPPAAPGGLAATVALDGFQLAPPLDLAPPPDPAPLGMAPPAPAPNAAPPNQAPLAVDFRNAPPAPMLATTVKGASAGGRAALWFVLATILFLVAGATFYIMRMR